MEPDWFVDDVRAWPAGLELSDAQLATAASLLCAISRAHGGELSDAGELSEAERRRHARRQAAAVLQRRATRAATQRGPLEQRPLLVSDDGADKLPLRCLARSRRTSALNLNAAPSRALATRPGIGPALAARIVEQRRRAGPFRRPDDLLAMPGLTPSALARIRNRVRVDDGDRWSTAPPTFAAHTALSRGWRQRPRRDIARRAAGDAARGAGDARAAIPAPGSQLGRCGS